MVSHDTNMNGGDLIVTEIDRFLEQVRCAIDSGNTQILDRRSKYMSTLSQLGITAEDVWDDIYHLSPKDQWRQDNDRDSRYPGFVWITKKRLHGERLYIKLKIKSDPKGQLLVLSYHIDKYSD